MIPLLAGPPFEHEICGMTSCDRLRALVAWDLVGALVSACCDCVATLAIRLRNSRMKRRGKREEKRRKERRGEVMGREGKERRKLWGEERGCYY